MSATPPPPDIITAPSLLRLDLGCGQVPAPGFEGVDIWPGAKHVWNLFRFPWPFADNSVGEVFCSHFIEHIPQCNVDPADPNKVLAANDTTGKNLWYAFFDELYRVMAPGAIAKIHWPAMRSNRAFQDPTHTRYPTEESLAFYLNAEWRHRENLGHYKAECDFLGDVGHSYATELSVKTPEVIRESLIHKWNHTVDFIATLTCRKPKWHPPAAPAK